MFSKLQLKSKIILILSFLLLCSVLGFGIFIILNTAFPKKAQAENNETIHIEKEEENKQEEEEIKQEIIVEEEKKEQTPPSVPQEPRAQTSEMDLYLTNSYKAGSDIDAGIYKVVTTDGNTSGQYTISTAPKEDVSFYDGKLFFNFRYVELKDGETIYLIDADIVKIEDNAGYADSRYVSGQYKIGFDLMPGSYRLVPTGQAGYVEVSATPLGDILFSRYVETSVEIELKDGQYMTISGVNVVK